jgi:hypothetical protein
MGLSVDRRRRRSCYRGRENPNQAVDRTTPIPPVHLGLLRATYVYDATTLFAALEVAMGRVSGAYGRHREEEFLDPPGQIARGSRETVRSPLPGAMDGQLKTRNTLLWSEPIDSDVQYIDRANLQVKRRAQLLPFVGDDQIDVVIE